MTAEEQTAIVQQLFDSLRHNMLEKIKKGDVPAEWDGIELRSWLLWKVRDRCSGGFTQRLLVGKRLRAFRNEMFVRNL